MQTAFYNSCFTYDKVPSPPTHARRGTHAGRGPRAWRAHRDGKSTGSPIALARATAVLARPCCACAVVPPGKQRLTACPSSAGSATHRHRRGALGRAEAVSARSVSMAPTATPLPRSEAQLRSSAAPCPAPSPAGRALELRHSYVLDEVTWRGFRNVYNDEASDEQLAKLLQYVRAELARLDEVLALPLRGTMNSRPTRARAAPPRRGPSPCAPVAAVRSAAAVLTAHDGLPSCRARWIPRRRWMA